MGTERKKPNLKLLSPTPGLVTLITATFLFPGNYRSPCLALRTADSGDPQTFFLSVSPEMLASPWPLPRLHFHQQKGAVEYVRATQQDFCTE